MFWSILRLPTTKTVLIGPAPSVVSERCPKPQISRGGREEPLLSRLPQAGVRSAEEARTISSLGRTTDAGFCPSITSSRSLTAVRPIASTSWEMTVSGGSSSENHSMSSKAMRAMSRPMRRPFRFKVASAPTAMGLSAASSAVGGCARPSRWCAPAEPLADWKSPKYVRAGSVLEPELPGRAGEGLEPVPSRGRGLGPGDVADALVALPGEMLHGLADAGITVGGHARDVDAVDGPVDEHRGDIPFQQRVQAGASLALRCGDHAVHALRNEGVQVPVLLRNALVGVSQQGDKPLRQGRLLGGVRQIGEKRVADVRNEQPDDVGWGGTECARLGVGVEVQLGDGGGHFLPGLRRRGRVSGQHPRRRGRRDAGECRHVLDGDGRSGHCCAPRCGTAPVKRSVESIPWNRFHNYVTRITWCQ